jgi:hypothetical protein
VSVGAWLIHPILICLAKILFDIIPGISQEVSWTLTNLSYAAGSYLMFHWVQGIPFDFNSGAYDNLNMWEQIDNGDQYTPTKKYLLSVPIVLFLVSTHYTHYALGTFCLNLLATIAVVIPKLPAVSTRDGWVVRFRLMRCSYIGYGQRSFQVRPRIGDGDRSLREKRYPTRIENGFEKGY